MADALKRKLALSLSVPYFYFKSKSSRQLLNIEKRCNGPLPLPPMRYFTFEGKKWLLPKTPLAQATFAKVFLVKTPKKADLIRAAKKLGIDTDNAPVKALLQAITANIKERKCAEPIAIPYIKKITKTQHKIVISKRNIPSLRRINYGPVAKRVNNLNAYKKRRAADVNA